jgi:hypothetical protein
VGAVAHAPPAAARGFRGAGRKGTGCVRRRAGGVDVSRRARAGRFRKKTIFRRLRRTETAPPRRPRRRRRRARRARVR